MANFFETQGGRILTGAVGAVAGGVHPFLGKLTQGALAGLEAHIRAEQEKRAVKAAIRASLGPASASPAIQKRTNPSGSKSSVPLAQLPTPSLSSIPGLGALTGFFPAGRDPLAGLSNITQFVPQSLLPKVMNGSLNGTGRPPPISPSAGEARPSPGPGSIKDLLKGIAVESTIPAAAAEVSRALMERRGGGDVAAALPARRMASMSDLADAAAAGGYSRAERMRFNIGIGGPLGTRRGWTLYFTPDGQAVWKRKARRMNVLNPRALSRAQRRFKGFEKFVKKHFTIKKSKVQFKKRKR